MVRWHPRESAYPVEWQMRAGRWGEVFAVIRQVHVAGRMNSAVVFELLEGGESVGRYQSGDDAAAVAWVRYVERRRAAGAVSKTVDPAEARAHIDRLNMEATAGAGAAGQSRPSRP